MIRNPHSFEAIVQYCEQMSSDVPDYLNELERETYLKMLSPQMISGAHLGQFLYCITLLTQPKTVVEIGTFTGYATLCFWRGMTNGTVHTYEINPETRWLFDKYVDIAGARDSIEYHLKDALDEEVQLPGEIDLSWIDADKRKNLDFFEKILKNTRQGGLIMIDNTLWSGKVLEEDTDAVTDSIKEMNKVLKKDERVETVMLPVRDGVTMAIKK
ncbi:MAG: class I SAM-dependent methyltransferase [Saprospiraceae bacterium]|nr:class I SAM-dependent methyltransferase [Saprospiraceae bacterium]